MFRVTAGLIDGWGPILFPLHEGERVACELCPSCTVIMIASPLSTPIPRGRVVPFVSPYLHRPPQIGRPTNGPQTSLCLLVSQRAFLSSLFSLGAAASLFANDLSANRVSQARFLALGRYDYPVSYNSRQERKKMPAARDAGALAPGESSSSMCKLAAFYRRYKIEFHISGMVFCLIGGKVRPRAVFFPHLCFLCPETRSTWCSRNSSGCSVGTTSTRQDASRIALKYTIRSWHPSLFMRIRRFHHWSFASRYIGERTGWMGTHLCHFLMGVRAGGSEHPHVCTKTQFTVEIAPTDKRHEGVNCGLFDASALLPHEERGSTGLSGPVVANLTIKQPIRLRTGLLLSDVLRSEVVKRYRGRIIYHLSSTSGRK